MSQYTLPARSIPLCEDFDVIVVGGGPSGCTAAVAAAREGARVLLIEATFALGGMGTNGLVPAWCPFSDKQRVIYGGLAERIFFEAKKAVPLEPHDKLDWVAINAEQLKRLYDDLLAEAGVKVLFGTFVSAVEAAEGRIDAIVAGNKAGLTAFGARVYVDATGDGDLAAWAGAEIGKGAEDDGTLQPATHCFVLTNVDTYAVMANLAGRKGGPRPIEQLVDSPDYPMIKDPHFCASVVGPDAMGFNAGHLWDVDNTDPWNLSQAVVNGRKLALQFRDGLAAVAPETFGNALLTATGSLLGIRETRRVIGDYVLTLDDWLNRQSFDDEIGRNAYFIDIHTAKDEIAKAREDEKHVTGRFENYQPGESHGIPYRCLTPKGLSNVLVAGRSISTDRTVQGSTRVMPTCLVTGEAAGTAAASAADTGEADVHAVDTDRLRKTLRENGAYLP